jgi:hypothetical protein
VPGVSVIDTWGSSVAERAAEYPCDGLIERPHVVFRAIDVDAPAALVFRWLCQMRVAPYSYDWIDNLGRRSPRNLIAGLDQLEIGQRFVAIFRLADFEDGRSITLDSDSALFGRTALTYRVDAVDEHRSRLVVKIAFAGRCGLHDRMLGLFLPAGDLVMMRKQLRTFKGLAERDARG